MFLPDDHVVDYVDAYLHDVLSHDDSRYVEGHCEECRICQVALEEARARFAAVQTLPPVGASEELIRATRKRIDEHRGPWITPKRVGWLAWKEDMKNRIGSDGRHIDDMVQLLLKLTYGGERFNPSYSSRLAGFKKYIRRTVSRKKRRSRATAY